MRASTIQKYRPFSATRPQSRTWPDQTISKAPIWCSVDLRDGNQALVNPMDVGQKLAMFQSLVKIGFKQIEIGFPSASQTEFDFCRLLIEGGHIPADVSVQILCQVRENLIQRSLEALVGAPRVIFHLYNSTSKAHRDYTFQKSQQQIRDLAVSGAAMLKRHCHVLGNAALTLEYSPESFTQTEPEFALEVCQAVQAQWQGDQNRPLIINLPSTVEVCTPNQYADLLEWFGQNCSRREDFTLSVHTHNDRGTGIAASEMALLAGAQRVEGTLFGNGERTGNADLVTLALNMDSQGIDSLLDFSQLPQIAQSYSELTGMPIHPRQPYAGELVFTAFSGGHQDAIKKALDFRSDYLRKNPYAAASLTWDIPYLPVDPVDINQSYQAVIRINSQSGKGGVSWTLKQNFGLEIPQAAQSEIGSHIYQLADRQHRELSPDQIWQAIQEEYAPPSGQLTMVDLQIEEAVPNQGITVCKIKLLVNGETRNITGSGNGPIAAVMHGFSTIGVVGFPVESFQENALSTGEDAVAAAWTCLNKNGQLVWGLGLDDNITKAGIKSLFAAVNRALN